MTVRRYDLGGGSELLWTETGDPSGPPAIVIPGLSDGLAPLSEPPSRRVLPEPPPDLGHLRVIVLSHRHPLPAEPTTRELADDVRRFVEDTIGAPLLVSGHSMGGMIAQHLAGRNPELVDRLVLSATLARADERLRARLTRWDRLLDNGDWRAFYADAAKASYTGSHLLRQRVVLRVASPPKLPHLVARHHALAHACRHHDATDVVADIDAPVLLLAGARDELVGVDRVHELAESLPECELHVIEGVGHGFAEQVPGRYVELLTSFLGDLTPEKERRP